MSEIRSWLLLVCTLFLLPSVAVAQDDAALEAELDSAYVVIEERMLLFQEELNEMSPVCRFRLSVDNQMPLTDALLKVVNSRLKYLTSSLNSFNVRWTTYTQAQQVYIAESDSLMAKQAEIQQLQQAVTDSLAVRQHQYEQLSNFLKAETFIWGQDKTYRDLYQQATKLSLSPKLAPQLEKVKAEEANLFTQAQTLYEQAKTAAEGFPGLKVRLKGLDQKFFELQSVSAKIQEMEYKPIIQRIKDYLLGLAAVAILLLFFNLLSSKLKSIKQAREQAKKLRETMTGQQDYPTI